TVSRVERGFMSPVAIGTLMRIAEAVEVGVEMQARWRGGDLDRMLRSGHAAMHEAVARGFNRYPAWEAAPEVTFAIGRRAWGHRYPGLSSRAPRASGHRTQDRSR